MASLVGSIGKGLGSVGKGIGRLFTVPRPPEGQKPASTGDAAVQQAQAEAARSRANAKGYRRTILSQNFLSADNPALKSTFGG